MASDFIKNGTNEEDMKGGVNDVPHHLHAHGPNHEDMGTCYHAVPSNNEEEGKNEHTNPEEVLDTSEKGEHEGAYPGFIRKLR